VLSVCELLGVIHTDSLCFAVGGSMCIDGILWFLLLVCFGCPFSHFQGS